MAEEFHSVLPWHSIPPNILYTCHMEAISRIKKLPHNRNILINTLGNYLGFAFAGFYILFFVRTFDPIQFGILSVLQAFSYLLANILSFGMPAAIYAHIPQYKGDHMKTFQFLSTNFLLLTAMSSISLVLIYLFIGEIDAQFFKTGAPRYQFMYALIGTQFFIWQNFIRDVLNASGRFLHVNIALNISNASKVIILMILASQGLLGITQVLIVLGIIGPIIVFTYVLLKRRWIVKAMLSARRARSEIHLGYTFIFFISTQVFQFATRADLFLVSYFLTRPEVGFYGLSQRIILAVVTSSDSITQVMSPQFAQIKTQQQVRKMLKHSFAYMLIPSGMFAAGILMPGFVYDYVFGAEYVSSTLATKALSFAYIPYSFLAAGLLFFLYTIKKPIHLLISNVIFLVTIIILNISFIPQFRLVGPAISYFTAFVIISGYLGYIYAREIKLLPKK